MSTSHPTLSPSQIRTTVRIVVAILVLDVLGIGLVVPVLPSLVMDLTGTDAAGAAGWYGTIIGVYAGLQFLCAPIMGSLSDRFGRRPILLLSVGTFGVDYLFQAAAPTIAWLFVGRAIAGVAGASVTTARATLADVSTPETRSRHFGLIGAAFGVGFVLGPATGGLLATLGDRVPFLAASVLSFLNLAFAWWRLPETLPEAERRPFRWAEAHPLASLSRLARVPGVGGLVVALALCSLAQRSMEASWVLHATARYGWGELTNGLTLAAVGVLAAVSQGGVIRPAVRYLGEVRVILGGIGLWGLGYLCYAFADTPVWLFAGMPLAALGAMAGPTMQGRIAGAVPPSEQGVVQGGLTAVLALVAALAPPLATRLLSWGTEADLVVGPGLPFLAGAGVFAVAGPLAAWHLLWRPRETS